MPALCRTSATHAAVHGPVAGRAAVHGPVAARAAVHGPGAVRAAVDMVVAVLLSMVPSSSQAFVDML